MKTLDDFFLELDYQQAYTYEERVDLFNSFQIPVSQKYFCPFFSFVALHVYHRRDIFNIGYSHSGAVSNLSQEARYVNGEDWKDQKNPDSKTERRFLGRFGNQVHILRNKETQVITLVKGTIGLWDIRFNPKRFTFTLKLNWERVSALSEKDRPWTYDNVEFDPERADLFLRLTGFKPSLKNIENVS